MGMGGGVAGVTLDINGEWGKVAELRPLGQAGPATMSALRKLLPAAAAVLASAGPGHAYTGNDLYEYCTKHTRTYQGFCMGYTTGAGGMYDIPAALQPPPGPICMPAETNGQQVRDVIVNYLKAHPETRHQDARLLVAKAMHEAFACP
jgi:Rap1a immunity proteins